MTTLHSVDQASAFRSLGPDAILNTIERAGHRCDGRLQALASYENRVYLVGRVEQPSLVAKFYRPHRWTTDQILEEHHFCAELLDADLPVIVPLADEHGDTVIEDGPYRFSLYAQTVGRPPSFDDPDHRRLLGRFAARMHNVGALTSFRDRPTVDVDTHGHAAMHRLVRCPQVPPDLLVALDSAGAAATECVEAAFEQCVYRPLRIHGDLHAGNILWTNDGPAVLDFDDCGTGPACADLWMFLSGDRDYEEQALADIVEGYEQFRPFPVAEVGLIEPLRTLRVLRHAAWIAERWEDPAFPLAFGQFAEPRYWQDLILTLKEQISAMQDPPLAVNL
ncbi:MAG: serine/threonine protein kinase [Pseudomonadota bacterium]